MQGNVNSVTKENELEIKYGMINFGEERELARASVKYILTDVLDIKRSYIRLGFHLYEFDRLQYYKDFGYTNLFDFCDANLGMDKSAISRCVNVFLNFAANDKGIRKMWIDERYANYSYSQLCEMVSMKDKDREKVKPEMTVKQIRELKKKNVSRSGEDVSPVATSQQDKFCISKWCDYKGAVLHKWIKSLNPDDVKFLSLYDESGKEIYRCLTCDVINVDDNHIILRVSKEMDESDFSID